MFVNRLLFYFSALAVVIPLSELAARSTKLEDRIKGAVIGSALADALGRVTSHLDTGQEIKKIYGEKGVSSVASFPEHEWILDGSQNKVAAYSDNTVLSLMVLKVLTESRAAKLDNEAMTNLIARNLLEIFGENKEALDPLFDVRNHSVSNLKKGAMLSKLFGTNQKSLLWWLRKLHDSNNSAYDNKIATEADSGSIMRAWPFGIFFLNNPKIAQQAAEYQTLITHRHPTSRASSVALATGMLYALKDRPIDDIINHMVEAAEKFDQAELTYKKHAKKATELNPVTPDLIAQDRVLTSDMIRYAAAAAKRGDHPSRILGTTTKKQDNNRSPRGYLLGYQADEALAAAVYLFVRYQGDFKPAVLEAVNARGNSALIASLVGALSGGKIGFEKIRAQGWSKDIDSLENIEELHVRSVQANKVCEKPLQQFSCTKALLGCSAVALIGWLAYTKLSTIK